MIRGMTAYSIQEKKFDSWIVTTELWSYNHKFLRVDLSLPSELRKFSEEIEKMIRNSVSRGKINLNLELLNISEGSNKTVNYNQELAKKIYKIGQKEKKENEKSLQMRDILLIPEVLKISTEAPELSKYWSGIKKLVESTFFDLIKAKERQGKGVAKDLKRSITDIRNSLKKIKKTHKNDKRSYSKNLRKKIKNLSKLDINEEKLEEETINYIRNKDINEEIIRIKSYLDLLEELLESDDAVGKKIDFIAQELLREINTLGAKKDNVLVKKEVIEIKEKIEKIREHSQNIE